MDWSLVAILLTLLAAASGKDGEALTTEGWMEKKMAALKKDCDRYGNEDSFKNFLTGLLDFKLCYQSAVKTVLNGSSTDSFAIFDSMCSAAVPPAMQDCFDNLTQAAKPCMSEDTFKKLPLSYVPDLLKRVLCSEDGKRVRDLVQKGVRCIASKEEEVVGCLQSTFPEKFEDGDDDDNSEESSESSDVSTGEQYCDKLLEVKSCLTEELLKCPEPFTSKFVDKFLTKMLVNSTVCGLQPSTDDLMALVNNGTAA